MSCVGQEEKVSVMSCIGEKKVQLQLSITQKISTRPTETYPKVESTEVVPRLIRQNALRGEELLRVMNGKHSKASSTNPWFFTEISSR